ncbi:hypothetical protein LG634_34050 [Streptomyces bambusae]|uniref:hypothetical protein n=1 Tax=Streptomyces bambusae TaxID=1550616 RepID=UPI001D001067|nr:hypothetical protein [Streptomyces bambusae]MCB5169812.1 hypothetical protein [Streptomyces bambusae]
MKRFHTAALATAAALSVLGPAALAQAGGPGPGRTTGTGTAYLQDPAGGNTDMKTAWTKGDKHKLSGQFRFHPGMDYKLKDKPGAPSEWGAKTPDLNTLVHRPKFEFTYEIATQVILKKGLSEKKGKHPVTLHAVLRDAKGGQIATVHEARADAPATLTKSFPLGKKVACDSGKYTVTWSVTRTGAEPAEVGGTVKWNASCKEFRDALSH